MGPATLTKWTESLLKLAAPLVRHRPLRTIRTPGSKQSGTVSKDLQGTFRGLPGQTSPGFTGFVVSVGRECGSCGAYSPRGDDRRACGFREFSTVNFRSQTSSSFQFIVDLPVKVRISSQHDSDPIADRHPTFDDNLNVQLPSDTQPAHLPLDLN